MKNIDSVIGWLRQKGVSTAVAKSSSAALAAAANREPVRRVKVRKVDSAPTLVTTKPLVIDSRIDCFTSLSLKYQSTIR